ncbi:hypothetical protein ACS8Y6_13770 [Salinisphaera sp. RV14]|uniref:hypothetical protein n=1 Tax=Salinisphaera sp. RV14 TaxID=3454140 RepID=UPI003F8660A1
MNKIIRALVLGGTTLLAACANSPYRHTRVVDVRPNMEATAKPPYRAPVVGVLVDSASRSTLENAVVAALRARGVNARAAMPIYGNKGIQDKSRAYLAHRLQQHGFDSAIGIHLVHKKIENVKVSAGPSAPAPAGATLSMRAEPLGPDFSLNETTYVARINFWDVKQQAIVWSATSVTYNPNGLKAGADQFASVVARQLTQAGLFDAPAPAAGQSKPSPPGQ